MPWTTANMPDQTGRTIVVTGSNSGVGYEAALEFARKGAHVVLACRNAERADGAVKRILEAVPAAKVERMLVDLGDLASVRAFAAEFLAKHPRLDVLVNNAGLMALPYGTTKDGFETQMGVNHFGPFALTGLLLERLVASAPARVVTLSSGAHRMGFIDFEDLDHKQRYERWEAYGQTKLANLLFTFELDRRLKAKGLGVLATAVHPGYTATELQTKGGSRPAEWLMRLGNVTIAQSAAMGALPTLYSSTMPDIVGSEYIGSRTGPSEMWGYPQPCKTVRRARSEGDAKRLWEISEERTGVRYALID